MEFHSTPVKRAVVGILSLTCLITGGVLFWKFRDADSWRIWQGAFVRIGVVLGAFWLALPSQRWDAAWKNIPPSVSFGLLGMIVLLAARPKIVIAVLPAVVLIVAVGLLVRPRSGPGRRKRR